MTRRPLLLAGLGGATLARVAGAGLVGTEVRLGPEQHPDDDVTTYRIYLLFDDLGFQTTYYCAANDLVLEQFADDISELSMPRRILSRSSPSEGRGGTRPSRAFNSAPTVTAASATIARAVSTFRPGTLASTSTWMTGPGGSKP